METNWYDGPGSPAALPRSLWWLALAWIIVAALTLIWAIPNAQDDLTERAASALAGTDIDVSFAGRDAQLNATNADQPGLDEAVTVVRNLRGVRTVDVSYREAALVAPNQPSPTTTTAPTTTTLAPTTTSAPAEPQFTASYASERIELVGTVPDQTTSDFLIAAAEARYTPGNVVNRLLVSEEVASPDYLSELPRLFELTADMDPWNFTINGGTVIFGGIALDQATRDRALAAIVDFAAGFGATLESSVEISAASVAATLTEILAAGANFATGSAELSEDAIARLATVVEILLANPSTTLVVEGHTDNVGDPARNLVLSQDRAQAVVDYLVAGGVQEQRLSAVGFGEDRPLVSNDTEEGRATNRRIEFVVEGEGS